MITGFDHVGLFVRDLPAATDRFARLLGRAPEFQGGGGGAAHSWFQLGNMALDVIAPDTEGRFGEGAFGARIRAHLESRGEGLWGLALRVADEAAATRRLARVGLGDGGFHLTRSDGVDGRRRYWRTAQPPLETTAAVTLMLCPPPRRPEDWPESPVTAPEASAVTGLDHVVVQTAQPDRAAALYGARLGLDLRLDRTAPQWGTRLLFFRCGDAVVEVVQRLDAPGEAEDRLWGLSFRTPDVAAAARRLAAEGFDVSDPRPGRKPGTQVVTVRDAPAAIPTLLVQAG